MNRIICAAKYVDPTIPCGDVNVIFLSSICNIDQCMMHQYTLIFHYPRKSNRVNNLLEKKLNDFSEENATTTTMNRCKLGWFVNQWVTVYVNLHGCKVSLFSFSNKYVIICSFRLLFLCFRMRCEPNSTIKQRLTKRSNSDAHQWYVSLKIIAKANPLKMLHPSEKC